MANPVAEKIKSLNATLMRARYAYYVESAPIMSDPDYDMLERELKELVRANPALEKLASVLTAVGSDIVSNLGVVKHRQPMLSLENAYTLEDLDKWASWHPAGTTYTLEPKIDGLSLSVRYSNYKLWVGLTRGDGTSGEDVTQAVLTIRDIPKTLPPSCPPDMEVRGEVFLTYSQFEDINAQTVSTGGKAFANPRNLASGTLKTKDIKAVAARNLSFLPWQVIGFEPKEGIVPDPDNPTVTMQDIIKAPVGLEHSQALDYLWRMTGGRQPQGYRVYGVAGLHDAIEKCRILREKLWKEGLGYPTDGVVIKVEEHQIRQQLGTKANVPNWAIAYKYPSERATTRLVSVTWQVGRTGSLTPVAELEPVSVGGSTVARVNLNNLTYIKKDLGDPHLGDTMTIYKGGDVIPQIEGIHTQGTIRVPIEAPTICPSCQSMVREDVNKDSGIISHTCDNPACPGRLVSHLIYIGGRGVLDIDGLGDVLAEQFVRDGIAPTLGNLWAWGQEAENALESDQDGFESACAEAGYSVAQIRSLVQGIVRTRTAPWDRWLQALGIPGIAKENAKTLANYLALEPEDFPGVLAVKLLSLTPGMVEGLGAGRIKGLHQWVSNPAIYDDLMLLHDSGVRPTSTVCSKEGLPLEGHVIVVTGEFGIDRDKVLIPLLEELGAVVKTGVSKKVNLLLVGSAAGKTKTTKAEELGIRTEGKSWLEAVLKAAGMEWPDAGIPDESDMLEEL